MDIADIAARLRKQNVSAFAKRSLVSRSTLLRIMRGWHNPTMRTIDMIERQLAKDSRGVDIDAVHKRKP